jgi:hypothetical protein
LVLTQTLDEDRAFEKETAFTFPSLLLCLFVHFYKFFAIISNTNYLKKRNCHEKKNYLAEHGEET